MRERSGHRLSRPVAVASLLAAGARRRRSGIDKQDFEQIERGRYLAVAGDCAACHTLPGSSHDFAGGRPIETPFGRCWRPTSRPTRRPASAPGPTTNSSTRCTKAPAATATRLYPAMPYTYYTKLTRDDALAIRAYLNTVPAGAQSGQSQSIAVPVQYARIAGGLGRAVLHAGDVPARPDKSARMESRRLSGRRASAIAACATRRRISLGGDERASACRAMRLQGWFAPNITNDARAASAAGRSTRSSPI